MYEELFLPLDEDLDVDRIRVSPSKIRCFMEDQAQYYFRYVERRPSAPSPVLFEGTTYHRGIEYALQHKKDTGEMPEVRQTLAFLQKFYLENYPTELGAPDYDSFSQIAQVLEVAYPVLETIQPKKLETYILTPETELGFDVQGYIDCIHTEGDPNEEFNPETDTVIDFKSKSQGPTVVNTGSEPQTIMGNFDELQLRMYGWTLTKATAPIKSEIIYLVKTRVPKVVRVPKIVTPEMMRSTMKTVSNIVQRMEEGVYTPNYGYWLCREDKCGFWKECHEKF